MARRRRKAIVEAGRHQARRSLVAGAGLLVFAGFASLTRSLPGGISGVMVVLGIGLLVNSLRLSRRYD